MLEKIKFEKLEVLNLGKNQIIDIKIFENVNFKVLKQLFLIFYCSYIYLMYIYYDMALFSLVGLVKTIAIP